MPGNPSRRHQHGIEPDIANAIVGILREPGLGSRNDTGALSLGHRPGGFVLVRTRLDLDEDQQASAAGDDVDLPDGLLQRRASMRNPLAMRKTAARLSADNPVRNAI